MRSRLRQANAGSVLSGFLLSARQKSDQCRRRQSHTDLMVKSRDGLHLGPLRCVGSRVSPYSMFVSWCWDMNGRGKVLSDTYLDSWRRSTGLGRIRLRHSNRPQPGELASSCLLLRFIAALHGGPGSFYGVDMFLRGPTGPKGVKMTRRLAGGSSDSFDNGRETFPAPRSKVPVPAIRSINNDIEPIYSEV